MTKLDQQALDQIVNAVITALGQSQAAMPKASNSYSRFLPKGSKAQPSDLASRDAQIVAAFARKGFKVTLMDRNDPAKPFDVRPFKGWLGEGRIVRKGQRGIRGLFHVTQTDPLPAKASAKPGISAEQKQLFAKAKLALKSKQAKAKPPQPTLV
jgi:hypothetical protein